MKVLVAAITLVLSPLSVHPACIDGIFDFEIRGNCNYTTVLAAFEDVFEDIVNVNSGCPASWTHTEELHELLEVNSEGDAVNAVQNICRTGWADYFQNDDKIPLASVPGPRKNYPDGESFIASYYNGGTAWNEEVATLYPPEAGEEGTRNPESNFLKRDAALVKTFYDGDGSYKRVSFPDYLPNFDTCEIDAVYCCWPSDRQAGDNNGNCAKPYDERCVDADPADNTDLCYVNFTAAAEIVGQNIGGGFSYHPHDDGSNSYQSEGPIHCHGFAWAGDDVDQSSAFKGNNLFYISMYDHMYQRGYVRNLEGAPMCACAEHMPVVSRSDCTQIDFEESTLKFKWVFDGSFSSQPLHYEIDYNSCQGIDPYGDIDNNDLWSYAHRLFLEDKYSADNLQRLTQHLVGDDPKNCVTSEKRLFAQNGFVRGYDEDRDSWLQVAGRDSLEHFTNMGAFSFARYFNGSNRVIKRVCANCIFSHQVIYYRRTDGHDIRDGFDLLGDLKFSRKLSDDNLWDTHFRLYSNLDDAIEDKVEKAWVCPGGYKYRDGFPGKCGPSHTANNQKSIFGWAATKADVAYYVQYLPVNGGNSLSFVSPMTRIGEAGHAGGVHQDSQGKMFVSGYGKDIFGTQDNFDFYSTEKDGDVTVSMKLEQFNHQSQWSKVALMIRAGLDPGAPHFSIVAHGTRGIGIYMRNTQGAATLVKARTGTGTVNNMWLKLEKRINQFSAYTSVDGVVWQLKWSTVTIDALDQGGMLQVGIAVASITKDKLSEAVLSEYMNDDHFFPSSSPSQSPAPTSIEDRGIDIGNVRANLPGKTFYAMGTGTFTMTGSGADIWSNKDGFHMVPLMDNAGTSFSISAYVEELRATHNWAKSGIMVRETLAGGSKNVALHLTRTNGVHMTQRNVTDVRTWDVWVKERGSRRQSAWVRLDRDGSTFTGYACDNGIDWEMLGSTTVEMQSSIIVSLTLTSHNRGEYANSTISQWSILA